MWGISDEALAPGGCWRRCASNEPATAPAGHAGRSLGTYRSRIGISMPMAAITTLVGSPTARVKSDDCPRSRSAAS